MENMMPAHCPVCGQNLAITKLTCPHCHTEISGEFIPCKYCALDEKMQRFLDIFLKCRGNIKEVERTLSISYPTVKGLLDELLKQLFPGEGSPGSKRYSTGEILDMLENHEITADEAAALLAGDSLKIDKSEER